MNAEAAAMEEEERPSAAGKTLGPVKCREVVVMVEAASEEGAAATQISPAAADTT